MTPPQIALTFCIESQTGQRAQDVRHHLHDRLDISARHYYRIRTQAINIIALRLWSAPAGEVDSWLEVLSILENW